MITGDDSQPIGLSPIGYYLIGILISRLNRWLPSRGQTRWMWLMLGPRAGSRQTAHARVHPGGRRVVKPLLFRFLLLPGWPPKGGPPRNHSIRRYSAASSSPLPSINEINFQTKTTKSRTPAPLPVSKKPSSLTSNCHKRPRPNSVHLVRIKFSHIMHFNSFPINPNSQQTIPTLVDQKFSTVPKTSPTYIIDQINSCQSPHQQQTDVSHVSTFLFAIYFSIGTRSIISPSGKKRNDLE